MKFNTGLKQGDKLDNTKLMDIFKCGVKGGIRRSLNTNTLVLISNFNSDEYENVWEDKEGILHFSGMGLGGDQSINYMHNRTLAASNEIRIQLHLFRSEEPGVYIYMGRVLLADTPYSKVYGDRSVLIFPLIKVGREKDIVEFFLEYGKQTLVNKRVIDNSNYKLTSQSIKPLITLMAEQGVDTFTSRGGWFLTKSGYFYNEYSKSMKVGSIKKLKEGTDGFYDSIKNQNKFINPYVEDSLVYQSENSEIEKEQQKKIKYIRLNSFYYKNELEIGPINFGDYEKLKFSTSNFYTSSLIGPNGTGKSFLISIIQKIFTDMYRLRVSKKPELPSNIHYKLEYLINESITYKIEYKNGKRAYYKNDLPVSLREVILPSKVISYAYTLQDRFSIFKQDVIREYEYFGVKKYISNNHIEKPSDVVAKNIMLAALEGNLIKNLKSITKFLGFNPFIRLIFQAKAGISLEGGLIEETIEKMQKGASHIDAVPIDDIISFLRSEYLRSIVGNKEPICIERDSLAININLRNSKQYENQYENFQIIWYLVNIGLLDSPSITMKKHKKEFPIEEASSGEFQYFSTMINILSKIKENSIVILDEPETSLHPTWQYKYISHLQKLFSDFSSCHFLIATHSHFIVADLEAEFSDTIIFNKTANRSVSGELLQNKTYGRSAEDILYNVFNMPTTRNHYLANDLDDILYAISIGKINNKIKEKSKRLKQVQEYLLEADPLRLLIDKIVKKVERNG
ncbi:hypothetical protein CN318_12450 [Bacillus cereus]|nr:hypothetical protein CN318_12450 [Bacillus cereus]